MASRGAVAKNGHVTTSTYKVVRQVFDAKVLVGAKHAHGLPDYAHTPNGITKLLNFVHTLNINRSIVVIGQAGERDPYKRPKVGNVVVENASYAIFCYEDPRSEDPVNICNDIISELKDTHSNYEIVIDRREAIEKAINMANDGDMVLILGKGNETYQKLKNETIYFNDIEEAYKAVENRKVKEGIN